MTAPLVVLSLALMLVYATLSLHYVGHWRGRGLLPRHPRREHTLLGFVLLVRAFAVLSPLAEGPWVSLGVGRTLAVVAWLMLLIYWTCGFFYRVEGLQLFMMPFAIVTLAFAMVFPGSHVVHDLSNPAFALHILVSMVAYSLFAIAAMVAILMLILDKALHRKQTLALARHLPPLLSLERMMFQILMVGFLLLTVSLLSGVVFSEEVFGQPAALTHKTVFAVVSWLIFGALLAGRQFKGWRGKLAVRWALSGFGFLLLAYIGSKVVLELVLQK